MFVFLKEMRNSVNRKVNCETANINKTVHAAVKQIEDITYIRDTAEVFQFVGWIRVRLQSCGFNIQKQH